MLACGVVYCSHLSFFVVLASHLQELGLCAIMKKCVNHLLLFIVVIATTRIETAAAAAAWHAKC